MRERSSRSVVGGRSEGSTIRPIDVIPAKAKLFRSVSDEARLIILEALGGGERRVTDLVGETRQSQSAVSANLANLHAAGLVVRRAAGREAWYTLAHPAVGTLLDAAEDIVIAASGGSYACISPCCSATSEIRTQVDHESDAAGRLGAGRWVG